MNRTFTYALAAIFGAATIVPALAQTDNFPDVPDNHWAYEALANLKKAGIFVGYPDGLVRGARPASRYEMAVAINAAYTKLKGITDGLDGQIKAISDKLNGTASASDLQNLKDALAALQNDVNAMKGWGEDIANLKRLADTFQKELQSLGVDVEAMKKDLGDLADRVTKLEKRKPAVDISGDVNLWVGGGNSRDNYYGLSKDGRINGALNPAVGAITAANSASPANKTGITQDLTILHEGAFTFAGTNDTGPKWKGTLVIGNMLGGNVRAHDGFGSQSVINGAGNGYGEGTSDVYFQDFAVWFNTSVAGLAFNTEIGRVGYKISPYMYQRIDTTSYFSNERWDNGLYYFDGGILGFNFGGAKLDIFGGRDSGNILNRSAVTSTNGNPIDPVVSGPIDGTYGLNTGSRLVFDSQLGANLNVPLSTSGNLNLAYLWLQSNQPTAATRNQNRLSVFGGSADFAFGKLKVEGGYSATDLSYNTDNLITKDNAAYFGKLTYTGDKWGVFGGYRVVEAQYLAPGDWGRLGVLRNPTNIEGFQAGLHVDLTNSLTLKAEGEFDKGKSNTYGTSTGFNKDTKINKYSVDLGYKVNPSLSLYAGYEYTEFKDLNNQFGTYAAGAFAGKKPQYQWTTIGLGYGLSDAAKLSIQYEISDIKDEFQVSNDGRFKGGFLTTQLSVKF